ncbi:MAG: hypothetical protein REI11_17315, partial [Patulibacter sp.]|nr:hypothetical protein [Patulibacter sp.]
WCVTTVLDATASPSARFPMDSPDSIHEAGADAFCADAAPVLWAADVSDQRWRAAALNLATSFHYRTVSRFHFGLARQPSLAPDLQRLGTVTLQWARALIWMRERDFRVSNSRHWDGAGPRVEDLPDIETPTNEVFSAFVEGELSTNPPRVSEFLEATPADLTSFSAGRHALTGRIDLPYFLASHLHVLQPLSGDEPDLSRRLLLAADLAGAVGDSLASPDDGRSYETPTEGELRLLMALGEVAVSATSSEAADAICRPILRAGETADFWVSSFLGDIWTAALRHPDRRSTFAGLFNRLVEFARSHDNWREPSRGDRIDLALICLNPSGFPRMSEEHASLFEAIYPIWKSWVEPRIANPEFAGTIATFIATPAGSRAIEDVLGWLAQNGVLSSQLPDRVADNLADMLAKLSLRDGQLLRRSADARAVLTALVAKQHAVALELAAKLANP